MEVSDFTSSRPKVSIENATYEVTADWTPMLRRHERSYAAMTYIEIESLLQTRVGENFDAIVRRLTLLLALQAEESRSLRKQMRLLYDIRSSIVHGGFEAIHPMHNELLDKRIDSIFARLLDASEYGNAVILSCFQNMIARGWVQLKFDEVVGGIGNENGK